MKPRLEQVGTGSLLFTKLDFLNGYQAGHLAYMTEGRTIQFSDTSLTTFLMEKLENLEYTERYSVGYVVGWLVSFATKGRQQHDC